MKITIIYDNTAWNRNLKPDWGFSCLVETEKTTLLFDTGANGDILLNNMETLGIDPKNIDAVFISHGHWDHTGGLSKLLGLNPVRVFIPVSCSEPTGASDVVRIKKMREIDDGMCSTGELNGIEQSLAVKTDRGIVVIAGCSHPGVDNILRAVSQLGKTVAIVGGLHGFDEFELLGSMETVCPTHCTQYIHQIRKMYPGKYIEGGAGKIIEFGNLKK